MERVIEEHTPEAFDGDRVDRIVAAMTGLSRSVVTGLVSDGAVRINKRRAKAPSVRIFAGDVVRVEVPEPGDPRPVPDASISFAVAHEDEYFVIINKPAGIVVHPGAGRAEGTLVNGLIAAYPEIATVGEAHRPGIVHRLDRDTSGLLVVARTPAAYEDLVAQMAAHKPERIYRALAWGHPERYSGVIDAPIGRSARHLARMTVSPQGRPAVTHYTVDERFDSPVTCSLLTCRLETGRTHQIRVHLRAIGHPVVGDKHYDGGRPGLDPGRPFLHAAELRFSHPVTGDKVGATAPLPSELQSVLDRCVSVRD